MARRADSDEHYVIDLCDELLGLRARRQMRFDFLLGDVGRTGRRVRLPVDAWYADLALVVEYHERQHGEAVAHFDKPGRLTASGVDRGEQRRRYDERRAHVLPGRGITLVVVRAADLVCDRRGRLTRVRDEDTRRLRALFLAHGIAPLASDRPIAAENG
jgi:hypothetical protein